MELVLDEASGELREKEGGGRKVGEKEVVRLYRDWIIPLTKEVEVSLTFWLGLGRGRGERGEREGRED